MLLSSLNAEEQLLKIESDLEIKFFLVARGGGPEQQILLLKRVRPGSTVYSKRMYDCEAGTYQDLGSWESLDDITAACPETEMRPIEEGTIAYQLWQYACGEDASEAKPSEQLLSPSHDE
jgi:hypothetical protein